MSACAQLAEACRCAGRDMLRCEVMCRRVAYRLLPACCCCPCCCCLRQLCTPCTQPHLLPPHPRHHHPTRPPPLPLLQQLHQPHSKPPHHQPAPTPHHTTHHSRHHLLLPVPSLLRRPPVLRLASLLLVRSCHSSMSTDTLRSRGMSCRRLAKRSCGGQQAVVVVSRAGGCGGRRAGQRGQVQPRSLLHTRHQARAPKCLVPTAAPQPPTPARACPQAPARLHHLHTKQCRQQAEDPQSQQPPQPPQPLQPQQPLTFSSMLASERTTSLPSAVISAVLGASAVLLPRVSLSALTAVPVVLRCDGWAGRGGAGPTWGGAPDSNTCGRSRGSEPTGEGEAVAV